jgi:hypothetical protein
MEQDSRTTGAQPIVQGISNPNTKDSSGTEVSLCVIDN